MAEVGRLSLSNDGIIIPTKLIAFFGALFPGLGCYFCIAYTYLFQYDNVLITSTHECPNFYSGFPSASYAIGAFEPQKYIWLTVTFIQTPLRLFIPFIYARLFAYSYSLGGKTGWFRPLLQFYIITHLTEGLALVFITIVNIKASYEFHTVAFMTWLSAFILNLFVAVILHEVSGLKQIHPLFRKTFYIKTLMVLTALPLVVAMVASSAAYTIVCTRLAHAMFSISEYIAIGIYSTYNFLLFFEAPVVEDGLNLKISIPLRQQRHTVHPMFAGEKNCGTDPS